MENESKIAVIGLQSRRLSQYWKFIDDGIQASMKGRSLKLDYHSPAMQGEAAVAEWQKSVVDKIIADGSVKAAGVAFLDPEFGRAAIDRLAGAGIPCIAFDTDVPDSRRAFFIGANNIAAGQTCAYTMAKLISFKGKIAIDTPSFLIHSCIERIGGFKQAMSKYRNIELVIEAGGSDSAEHMKKAAEQIAAAPGIEGIFCASGGSAKANAEALKRAGRAGKTILICVNVDAGIRDLIREGAVQMAIGQRPYSIGYRLVNYLAQAAEDGIESVMRGIPPSRIADTGIHTVTQSNLDSYIETLNRMRQMES